MDSETSDIDHFEDSIQGDEHVPESLTFIRKVMFAAGEFGWSLTCFGVSTLISYFYMPPIVDGKQKFPFFVSQQSIFFIFTTIGLINAVARVFDAITDPVVAGVSDKLTIRFGRRRTFMLLSCVPFAISSVLVFLPIVSHVSIINVVWLLMMIVVFYWSMTCYVTPYSALLSECGHSDAERLNMSSMLAIGWAMGYGGGNCVYAVSAAISKLGFSDVHAFQITMASSAILGLVCMILPIIAVNERRHTIFHPSDQNIITSFATAITNGPFLSFGLAVLLFFFVQTCLTSGMIYFTTVLLGLSSSYATYLMIIMFVFAFLLQAPVNVIAHKFGRKILMITGFTLLSVDFILLSLLGLLPWKILSIAQLVLIIVTISYPVAVFLMLPNAIISEIATADMIVTGRHKAAMFFAAKTFSNKVGISLANLAFPSLLLFGKSTAHPMGVRLVAVMGAFGCVAGGIVSVFFNESKVMRIVKNAAKASLSDDEEEPLLDDMSGV